MKNHQECESLLDALIDGELSEAEAAEVRAHAETCAICQEYLNKVRIIQDALSGWDEESPGLSDWDEESPEIQDASSSEDFIKQVMASLPKKRRPQWIKVALPLAACFAVVVVTVFYMNHIYMNHISDVPIMAPPTLAPSLFDVERDDESLYPTQFDDDSLDPMFGGGGLLEPITNWRSGGLFDPTTNSGQRSEDYDISSSHDPEFDNDLDGASPHLRLPLGAAGNNDQIPTAGAAIEPLYFPKDAAPFFEDITPERQTSSEIVYELKKEEYAPIFENLKSAGFLDEDEELPRENYFRIIIDLQ